MVNGGAKLLVAGLLAAMPTVATAQDAAALLDELKKSMGNAPEAVRISAAGSGYRPSTAEASGREHFRIEAHTQDLDPRADPAVLWTTPHGFLAGATSRAATVADETLMGTTYRVVSFTGPHGRTVKGYVTDQNLLERIRTEVVDPTRGKVQFEAVFMSWVDFAGVKYPSVIIHRENDEVSRILIVDQLEPISAAAAPVRTGE